MFVGGGGHGRVQGNVKEKFGARRNETIESRKIRSSRKEIGPILLFISLWVGWLLYKGSYTPL